MGHPDLSRPVGSRLRDETPAERADRNFSELLQELRVMQTGVQVLTGFLLTLPFQARFAELDAYQRTLYLVLVVLAVVTTGVLITPVSLHRGLFQKGLKRPLVAASDELARVALVLLALVVTGTAMLAFDVVVSRTAGIVLGAVVATMLLLAWIVLPVRIAAARAAREPGDADAPGRSSTASEEQMRGSATSDQARPARKNGAP